MKASKKKEQKWKGKGKGGHRHFAQTGCSSVNEKQSIILILN